MTVTPEPDKAVGHSGPRVNVLIVASALWIGGAEMVIGQLARTIDRRRFNVTVYQMKGLGYLGEELVKDGVDVVGPTTAAAGVDYLSFRKLLKVLWQLKIDVVHTHTAHGLADAGCCRLLMPRLKIIHTFHFGNYPHTRPRIMWLERVFSRVATRLAAVGEVQRRQIQAVYNLDAGAVKTIWNGVADPVDSVDPAFRGAVADQNQLVIGTIATLIPQKGLRDFLAVAKRIRDMGHHAKFVVVGGGPLQGELEELRRELGLEDSVVFTGWMTHAANVALPAFDVFFQSSLWEAMSVVILEAMAAAKAIVATRVGENPHVIRDGVEGLLADPGDVEGMAALLNRLLDDPSLRARLGRTARKRWEEHFTVAHMAWRYEQAYLEALQ